MHEALKRVVSVAKSSARLSSQVRGDIYEEVSRWALQEKLGPLGLSSLHRVGGSGDRGVDLVGDWNKLDLLVQCKATNKKISGALWRDLRGVSTRRAQSASTQSIVALISPLPVTQAGLVEFTSSDSAFLHFLLPWSAIILAEQTPDLQLAAINLAAEDLLSSHNVDVTRL